jgi:transglutaminase-like putative cysteine protease
MKLLRIISFWVIMLGLFCVNKQTAMGAADLYQDNNNGTLTITYSNVDNAKMKIGITKEEKSCYYNINNGENSINVPLTMGNGTYNIRIYKNIAGTRYSVVISEKYSLQLENSNDVFLQPNVIVNYNSDYNAILKANELTKKCKSDKEKANTIYKYVVNNYLYDYDKYRKLKSGYIPDIQIIYKLKKGVCYDISALMAAMLRSQGIYTKLITGYTTNISVYHAWNLIYDTKQKKWITVDATYDICKIAAGKKIKMIKKDNEYSDMVYQY